MTSIRVYKTRHEAVLEFCLPAGGPRRALCESWDLDHPSRPDEDDAVRTPAVVLNILEGRIRSYWTTDREDKLAVIFWCRQNMERINREWATGVIRKKQKQAADLAKEIDDLRGEYLTDDFGDLLPLSALTFQASP